MFFHVKNLHSGSNKFRVKRGWFVRLIKPHSHGTGPKTLTITQTRGKEDGKMTTKDSLNTLNTNVQNQHGCFRCLCIRDAPLKVDLMWTHAVVQRVSGRMNKLLKTVRVRLVRGWSPNGQSEFDMPANEKVNVLITKELGSKQRHFNLKPHRRKQ